MPHSMQYLSIALIFGFLAGVPRSVAGGRADLGINITWPADWSQDHVFADVMKTAREWSYPDTWTLLPPELLDAQGWPKQDARCFIWANLNMQGTYHLSMQGRASVALGGGGEGATISNLAYDSVANRTTAVVTIASSGTENFWMDFTGTSGGVRNVKLMRPTFPGSPVSYPDSVMITDAFTNAMAPFSTIRFMQFTATIFSSQRRWSDRVMPDAASFNRNPADFDGRGASWECVLQIANTLQKDAWINVPLWADDDYIRNLALLFRDGNAFTGNRGLDPSLHLYIELSNEIWNYEQNQNKDSAVAEVLTKGDPDHLNFDNLTLAEASNGWEWGWRRPGAGIVRISRIFREVFGDAQMMTRIRPVLCWQAVRHATAWAPLTYIEKTQPQPVSYYLYAGGGSAYYSPDLETGGLTLDSFWESASMGLAWWRDTWPDELGKCSMMFNSFLCNAYGIKRVAYEGGPSFDSGGPNDSVMALAWSDPRLGQEITEHQNAWNAWGGDLLAYYVFTQDYRWAFASSSFDLSNPKYQAIVGLASSAPEPIAIGNAAGETLDGNAFRLGYGDWNDTTGTGPVWRHKGSWVSYLYRIATDGLYRASVNLTTYDTLKHVEWWMDGRPVETTAVPSFVDATGDIGPVDIRLSPGLHTLRIDADVEGWIVNHVALASVPTEVNGGQLVPRRSRLEQNFPNPFNPKTVVRYQLPVVSEVRLVVYDVLGRVVRTLVNERKLPGKYSVEFDGTRLASGMYILRLQAGDFSAQRKMLLIR